MSQLDCIYCSGEYGDEHKPPCSAPKFEAFQGVELCVTCDHYRECHTGMVTMSRERLEAALDSAWDGGWRTRDYWANHTVYESEPERKETYVARAIKELAGE